MTLLSSPLLAQADALLDPIARVSGWFQQIWSRPILALVLFTLPLLLIAWRLRAFPTTRLLVFSCVPVALTGAIVGAQAIEGYGPMILLMVLFTVPLLIIAWRLRSTPVKCVLVLCCVPIAMLAAIAGATFMQGFGPVVALIALDIALLLLCFFDLVTLPRRANFSAERECLKIASLDRNHDITLTVNHHSAGRSSEIVVRDDVPQEFTASKDEFPLTMKPRSRAVLKYELTASRRGAFEMEKVFVRLRSWLGLWKKYIELPVHSAINVYPDMKQLSRYALLARTNRLSLVGVRRTRRIGQDHEFERLRDYTQDDNYRHLDWRATARRHKLTVRDFQSSQSQRVIFLIDCGRMMTNRAAGLSLLDHALNAMLMLSYVALQRGDAVGMIAFSDSIHSYVPPRGGMNQMNQLLHASYDRFPNIVESRYDQAFRYLSSHCQKRSLVVLITNIIDEVNANQLHQYLGSIAGRHLPLGVLMRDHRIFDAAEMASPTGRSLYRSAAAAEILTWRHQVINALEHRGVLSLDTFPEDMTAPLVNRYLEIKARHLL